MQSLLSYWGQTEFPAFVCLWMMFTKSWQSFERLEVIVQNMKDMSQGLGKIWCSTTFRILRNVYSHMFMNDVQQNLQLWQSFEESKSAFKICQLRVLEIRMQIFLESYAIPALILGANWVSCWFWESILCRQSERKMLLKECNFK